MHPLLHLGPLVIPAYGTIIFIGLLFGVAVASLMCKKYNFSKLDILLSTILACIGLIIGAKLVYMITVIKDIPDVYRLSKGNIFYVIFYMFGGYVFYGGLIGALLGYTFYCKWFHAFGRIGCFMGGCCYGIKYHGIFAVNFPYNQFVEDLGPASRFPVQLLEALLNFILFIILLIYARKKRKSYNVLGIYLIGYSVIRFSLEFLRGDLYRGVWLFGISTSQIIGLLLIPVGIFLLLKKESLSD